MRRLIVTAAAIVLLGVWIAWTVFYPVKVTLVFDYRGKHFETSYLTTAKMHFNDPVSFFRLDLGRHVTRVELPDASFIELRTDWPIFHFGAGFKNGMPLMVSWLWLDNGKSPKQIVIGDTLTRPPIGSSRSPQRHHGWRRTSLHRLAAVNDHGVPDDEGGRLRKQPDHGRGAWLPHRELTGAP